MNEIRYAAVMVRDDVDTAVAISEIMASAARVQNDINAAVAISEMLASVNNFETFATKEEAIEATEDTLQTVSNPERYRLVVFELERIVHHPSKTGE